MSATFTRGSLTFTEQYIVADKTTKLEDYEKKILVELRDGASETVDPEIFAHFVQSTRFIYQFLKSTLTPNLINYILNITGEDRSDIMVFIVLMSILLGDSRSIIENMSRVVNLNKASDEELKNLMNILSYIWRDNVDIEAQRRSASMWGETLRHKGTEDAFITTIIYNVIGASIKQIIIGRDSSSTAGLEKMTISSPYTQFPSSEGEGYLYSEMSSEEAALLRKLEQLRPLGVYVYYTHDTIDLKSFVYWRSESTDAKSSSPTHSLVDQYKNFIPIADYFIVTEGSTPIRFTDPSVFPKYNYGLPMSMNFVDGLLTLEFIRSSIILDDYHALSSYIEDPDSHTLYFVQLYDESSIWATSNPYIIFFPTEGYSSVGDERAYLIHFVSDYPGLDYVTLLFEDSSGTIDSDLMSFEEA